ncbi:hypothetical protein N656DRAFT_716616 [Canariomyces notabilis]|uniref:Uncharacterized protein n=1 Tax=Canariomyces notabilis TaxID=2074819 RepID=A0AAN6QJA1_9PEZI|nr:hypothetical protein N656DRAFT_716616 [Canariomyces arenarius]
MLTPYLFPQPLDEDGVVNATSRRDAPICRQHLRRGEIAQQLLGKEGNFSAYFKFYDDIAQRNNDYHLTSNTSLSLLPMKSDCVLLAASVVKSNVSTTKRDIEQHYKNKATAKYSGLHYSSVAVSMAVQAMFMVDPAAKEWHSADFAIGDYRPSSWLQNETLEAYILRLFPTSLPNSQEPAMDYRALKAHKLQKRLGVRFQPTNHLDKHLLFDERRNRLYIFHHVAFLKAHLSRYESSEAPLTTGPRESLEGGTLPPRLLVETLYTLQAVIFPSIDPDSAEILDELIEKRSFDQACAEYEGYKVFRNPPQGFRLVYWEKRMAHLHRLMSSRPPRNKLECWFHRHSNDRNALFIALLALLISILVGIVSIGWGCVQIWIAWMVWKYPTAPQQ